MSHDSNASEAARLFEACRRERPGAVLKERTTARLLSARPAPRARRIVVACVLLAAGVALGLGLGTTRSAVPSIGAERFDGARQKQLASVAVPHPIHPPALTPAPEMPSARPVAAPAVSVRRLSLEEETQALGQVQAELEHGRPQAALVLLAAYDRRGGRSGALSAEAMLLRMRALAASGQSAQASEHAQRFVESYPNSPLVDRARKYVLVPLPGNAQGNEQSQPKGAESHD